VEFSTPLIQNTDFNQLDGVGVVLLSMRRLSIYAEFISAAEVERLGRIMPNLTSLRISVKDYAFMKVCETWPNLQKLEIHPFELSDKGLLGIVNRRKYQRPNITDLKGLVIFLN